MSIEKKSEKERILAERKAERTKCDVYSRIVGYLRPVSKWNLGKQAEFGDRITYDKKRESYTE